jgi:hypothetical protein
MRCRRKGQRPAAVVDRIKADDGPEFEALVKHIAKLGFGQASFTRRSLTLDVPEYFGRYLSTILLVGSASPRRRSQTRSPPRDYSKAISNFARR